MTDAATSNDAVRRDGLQPDELSISPRISPPLLGTVVGVASLC